MSDVSYARQRHTHHELVPKGRQILLDTPHNETIGLRGQLAVQSAIKLIGDACVVVRPEVSPIFGAPNLSTA